MNMWTAIVVIVALSSAVRVMRYIFLPRHGTIEDNAGNQQMLARGPDPDTRRELEALRERVKVLERIATEDRKSQSIAAEIESLRNT